jgi:preprotein translocase subunit SecG
MIILFMVLLFFMAVFLILLILIQRGKGGGLSGAFGGLGGQSAFGTKAGDTFTRITIGVAAVWILLCILSVRLLATGGSRFDVGPADKPVQQGTDTSTPASGGGSGSTPGGSGGG